MHQLTLHQLQPILIAAYIKDLRSALSIPSVKQHLAAIRMLFDHLVTGQALPLNPAASVRGLKYVVTKGRTPALSVAEARERIDSIETATLKGLRDRALIAAMVYTFARVGAVTGLCGEDYFQQGKRWRFRFHKRGEVPVHRKAEAYMDTWIAAAGIGVDRKPPLFRTFGRDGRITTLPMYEYEADAPRVVKTRGNRIWLPASICRYTFRATGITAYLENGGAIEKTQAIAAHATPRTTKLYDRTTDILTLSEIERIAIRFLCPRELPPGAQC